MTYIARTKQPLAVLVMLIIIAGAIQTPTTATATTTQGINDANIVAIVSVADGLDIDYGQIALSKSKNKQIREFAQRMVTDHTAVQKGAGELANKLGVTPEENTTSKGLAAGGVTVKAQLNKLKGKDFDKYYIDNEAAYHALVVKAVEETLIPGAQNAELKTTLISVLPLFKKHLEHAQLLQANFGKKTLKGEHKMGASH